MPTVGTEQLQAIPINGAAGELSFFFAVFVVAFATCVARTIRDDQYRTVGHCISVGVCSGGLGFCVVALALGPGNVPHGFDWFYLGLSALVGLLGKEQDKLIRFLIDKLFGALGITDDDQNGKRTSDSD